MPLTREVVTRRLQKVSRERDEEHGQGLADVAADELDSVASWLAAVLDLLADEESSRLRHPQTHQG